MSDSAVTDARLRALQRLEALTGLELVEFLRDVVLASASPDLALMNLERWLAATSNARIYMEQLVSMRAVATILIEVFGASQPIADALIQNPELAAIVLDPNELRQVPSRNRIIEEGRSLLRSANSYLHELDRIRFLRQRWFLPIVLNDLRGLWSQETVWRATSDLAEAVIELCVRVVWHEFSKQRSKTEMPQMSIIAFGKLGGNELNYSSDIDLVYVIQDDLDEETERNCTRFFELLGRAISDRMGRGSLYRIDLRLRPYGSAGPILRSMRSYESYYGLYAEPWELQALLRSRTVWGDEGLKARWEAMRTERCFPRRLSEVNLEQMFSMKRRIEEGAGDNDIKRGEGGIRDVEFLVQILQMVHGYSMPDLRAVATLSALSALETRGILEHSVTQALNDGYTFLRKLEHRVQIVGDRQTHSIPPGNKARHELARLMGFASWPDLGVALEGIRFSVKQIYRSTFRLELPENSDRSKVLLELGSIGPAAVHWFDGLPESSGFYQGLVQNEGSLKRIRKILWDAPILVNRLKASVPLTELLMSGEIEESFDPVTRIRRLPLNCDLSVVAEAYLYAHTALLVRWALAPKSGLNRELSALGESLLTHCVARLRAEFDIIALGSFGSRDYGPGSDADVIFLVDASDRQMEAEATAERTLAMISQLKQFGAPFEIDLRLRPEGSKGLLVRTYEGMRAYSRKGMEMWERLALGNGRLIIGSSTSLEVIQECSYGTGLTHEALADLLAMKHRIETERLSLENAGRDIKLGPGGLNDIEWLVHLIEMRNPRESKAGETSDIEVRIQNLAEFGALTPNESEVLRQSRLHLLNLRTQLYLMGIADDTLPANQDKLDRIAVASGYLNGLEYMEDHSNLVNQVRRIYLDGVSRLQR